MLTSLRDFVPAKVVPGQLLVTGMGDLVNGKVVPGYLLTSGMSSLVPSSPTGLTIQPNSVMSAWNGAGMSGIGCGGDCGCGGSCGGHGMGQLSLSSITAPFETAFTDIQTAISTGSLTPLTTQDYLVIGGTAVGLWLLFGKKGRR